LHLLRRPQTIQKDSKEGLSQHRKQDFPSKPGRTRPRLQDPDCLAGPFHALEILSGIDPNDLSGNVAGRIRNQESHYRRDVLRCAEALDGAFL